MILIYTQRCTNMYVLTFNPFARYSIAELATTSTSRRSFATRTRTCPSLGERFKLENKDNMYECMNIICNETDSIFCH